MAFVKFMRNKFFHPHTFENQKRTWIAEQKHESDIKRQEDLHKQYIKEQAIYENKNLLRTGKLTQDDKLAFMYEPPMECRKKEEKMELREVRFEWQKNAPRAGDYAKNLDVADCPFGIEVRNTKCIKCGVWGHMNTDKICPLFNRGLNTEDNPPDLGKEDPMSLLNSMEQGGLKMRKGAVNAVMDVHDNKYRMLEDAKLDPELAFIANLTDKQKRKLMRKLNKTGAGGLGVKAKNKKKKEKKKKKSSKEEEVEEAPTDKAPKNKHRAQKVDQSQEEQVNHKPRRDSDLVQEERGRRSDGYRRQHSPENREERLRKPEHREERQQHKDQEEWQSCAPVQHRERRGGRSRSPSDQRKEERLRRNSGARRGMTSRDEKRSPRVERKRDSRSPRVQRNRHSRSPKVERKRDSRSPRDRKRRYSKSPRRRRVSRSSPSKSPEQQKHRPRQLRSPDSSKHRRDRKDSGHDRSRDNKRDTRKQDADKSGRSETRKVKPRNSSTSSSSSSASDAVPVKSSRVKDKRRGSDDSDRDRSNRNKRGRKPKVVVKRRKRRNTSSSSSD